jgi:glycosyltransferase involved in cell wall biosynthesis
MSAMPAAPRLTVYIASHNYGAYLGDAIESVLRQTVEDWELLVIDDGSSDDTAEVMQLYDGHPQIRLFRTEGIGLPAVCNFALERALGRYIIRLDGDDIFDDNILLVLGRQLDRNPELALVFPDYYLIDEHGEIFAQERRRRLYVGNHMLDAPPNGACTLIRTEVLRAIGGYRIDLGAQDGFDLWSRIVREHKAANVNLPLFYYRRHGANLTTNTHRIINARRQIKKDAVLDRLRGMRPVVAIIPCRRNFDFEPDLWNQKIGDRTLLDRDIATCLASNMIDLVVVTCDNPDAAEHVRRFDDPRLHFVPRSPESTLRSSNIAIHLEGIVRRFDPALRGITVLRYIQTPFVTTGTLEEAVSSLVMNDADSASAVEEIKSRVFRRSAHGLETLNPRRELSSDFDAVFRDAQTCTALRSRNLANGSLLGASMVSYLVSAAECFFITSRQDLSLARLMAAEGIDHRAVAAR